MLFPALLAAALAGPGTVVLGVTDAAEPDALAAELAARGLDLRACYPVAGLCFAESRTKAPPPLEALAALPTVRYAEADQLIPAVPPPAHDIDGTADCAALWDLTAVRAPEAWQRVTGTNAPRVAIEDSGFLDSHVDLAGRIVDQWDYGNGDAVAEVEWSAGVPAHGTFIAGMIAAVPDNGVGRAGLAPDARIFAQKIADSGGALYFSYATEAMAALAEGNTGVRAVNYSISSSSTVDSFRDAVRALGTANIVLVAAAANCSYADCYNADNDAYPQYPGNFTYGHVLSVAGSTESDDLNSWSHYGATTVDLAAPGVSLCSLGADDDHDTYTSAGTSYAAPLVTAAVVLLLELHPDLTAIEVGRVLRASAHETSGLTGKVRANGRLDMAAALATAVPRMVAPGSVTVDGEGELVVELENVGDPGTAHVVIVRDEEVDLAAGSLPSGWTVQRFDAGASLTLPDAGAVTLARPATVLTGPMAAHAEAEVVLLARGRATGSYGLTVRTTLESDGADYLNAPYDAGVDDGTGFLGTAVNVTVTAVSEDTGDPDTGGPNDTDTDDTDDTDGPGPGDPPQSCGCGHGGAMSTAWPLALLGLGLRRRRR